MFSFPMDTTMIKIKISSKILLIVFIVLSLFPSSYNQVEMIFLFALFLLRAIFDGIAFKYISFITGISGACIFNPIFPLEFSDSTFHLIELGFLIIINIWVLVDFFFLYWIEN
jgi:hypothetical protein